MQADIIEVAKVIWQEAKIPFVAELDDDGRVNLSYRNKPVRKEMMPYRGKLVQAEHRYLSIKECSEYTGISVKTLYRWSREQKLPSRKLGHILRFDSVEIEGWLGRFKKGDTNADLLS